MGRVRSWLRLVRAPNLATAVADVIAGAVLAGAPPASLSVVVPALGSAALYAGGVALNDAFDVDKDRVHHPTRPIPSGAITRRAARAGGAIMLCCGVASGAVHGAHGVLLSAAIAAAIVLYDLLPERASVGLVAAIATCRGLNLLRGGAADLDAVSTIWPYAACHAALVAAITIVSQSEEGRAGKAAAVAVRVLPFLYAGPVASAFSAGSGWMPFVVTVLAAELALWVVRPAFRRDGAPMLVVPRAVFSLTLVGALYALGSGAFGAAAFLVAAFIASRLVARALAQSGS